MRDGRNSWLISKGPVIICRQYGGGGGGKGGGFVGGIIRFVRDREERISPN